jgi:hypothetical protein
MTRLLLLAFGVLAACAGGPVGFKSPVTNESTLVHYVSREQAEIEERKKARRELRDPRLFNLPANGHLELLIGRPTLEAADTAQFQVIFARGEEVLGRIEGPRDTPEMPVFVGGPWTNTLFVQIPEDVARPFEVLIVDELAQVRYEFLVREDGRVKRVRRSR